MARVLRAAPSNSEQLSPWQLKISETLSQLHQETFEKRKALTHLIQEFPKPRGEEAVADTALAMQIAYSYSPEEAESKARAYLMPDSPDFAGSRDTCILS